MPNEVGQRNDFTPHEYSTDKTVEVSYIGHPGDRPSDVRARPFFVQWKDGIEPIKFDKDAWVFKVEYKCLKNCSGELTRKEESSDDDDQHSEHLQSANNSSDDEVHSDAGSANGFSDDEVNGSAGERIGGGRGGRPKKTKSKCKVRLVVSVCLLLILFH